MKNRMTLLQGDITKVAVDAIVNAANNSLMGGGGVDGAIHRAGGPAILEACLRIREQQGDCPTGEAVITTGGNLPAAYVIHTVGPVWQGGKAGEDALLANCYRNSFRLATERGLSSIAFPNISTGVYGFPKERAASVAIREVRSLLAQNGSIRQVFFVTYDDENHRIYQRLLEQPQDTHQQN
jgi:O-acetyl-ADP-ribose deacetylase (regulator of RNase III)